MIIKNCKLLPFLTQSGAPETADVVISGNKIEAILPCNTACSADDQVLDIHGATLMPGLIDAHVHLFNGKRSGGFTLGDRDLIPARWSLDAYGFARWFLDNGYTTVRDCGDAWHFPALALRNAINDGDIQGPRIYGSGVTIVPYTPGFDTYAFMCAFYSTAADVRKEARNQFYHGSDFIKLYGTGSLNVDDSLPGRRIMMKDEIAEAVAVAESKGSYCACHCHGAEACDVMVELGVRTIEHASYITDETCKKLDGRKDVGLVPTIGCSSPEVQGISKDDQAAYEKYNRMFVDLDACIKNAYDNYDILMGWGTDMDIMTMERVPYTEWQARKMRIGCSNEDLLKQATINSAILMGIEDKLGTVAVGKLADLIVVDGDPAADIEAMYQKPLHVIKDGQLIR